MSVKRRIDVMLSSTFIDLEEHRAAVVVEMNRQRLTPIAMEFSTALPDSDAIDASLAMVEGSDAYIGVIGWRYGNRPVCALRNSEQLSLTELEYNRAVKRGLPRLMFIMAGGYGLTLDDLEAAEEEGQDGRRLRKAFIERVRADRVAADFTSLDDFKLKASRALPGLLTVAPTRQTAPVEQATKTAPAPPTPDDILPVAAPGLHFVRKPYIEKRGFAGRHKELDQIDDWAAGADAMLLFHAIGGMGKSMLVWHWLRTRSEAARKDWAGRFWYSFYEQGADLNDFCVHALAYIHGSPPRIFQGRSTLDLGLQLSEALNEKPWLLVLDGLERVLVAYNRSGKEHMTDEDAVVVRDDMGLDREPRDCFRPEDGDLLGILSLVRCGKLLVTSRLTPAPLTGLAGQAIQGVRYAGLEGLAPEDAEDVLRHAGVSGDGWQMRRFLEEQFGCHPLSVGIVAGQVMTFLDARGDFDRWREHPRGGADPLLINKGLRGRQNHILARAFESLEEDEKALLGSLAMASIEITPEVMRLLNPMRPIEPTPVTISKKLSEREFYLETDDEEVEGAYQSWRGARLPGERARASAQLDDLQERRLRGQIEKHRLYLAALEAWRPLAAVADAWIEKAVPGLEARGLLQYDRNTRLLDIHPAIRHTALISLSPEVRKSTGQHVSDALSSRPVVPFTKARTREDLALPMTRVQALNAAGKFDEGWNLYATSGLSKALQRLHYPHDALEILRTYFPEGWAFEPVLTSKQEIRTLLSYSGDMLSKTGRTKVAISLAQRVIEQDLSDRSLDENALARLHVYLFSDHQIYAAHRIQNLLWRVINRLHGVKGEYQLISFSINSAYCCLYNGSASEALERVDGIKKYIEKNPTDDELLSRISRLEVEIDFYTNVLTHEKLSSSIQYAKILGNRYGELKVLEVAASWCFKKGMYKESLKYIERLIEIANDTGLARVAEYEVKRAASLAAMGRTEQARRMVLKVEQQAAPPSQALAKFYMSLDDQEKAAAYAAAAYRKAWRDGPPYCDHWNLEESRKVLRTLGEPEPVLPPFDAANFPPFEFEAAIERLTEEKAAEKARADGRKPNGKA